MPVILTEKEHKARIDAVIDYIIKNLNSDITLKTLSEIANYSPFHFQRIFKQVMGETPKQYVTKLKLETALHLMIIHPDKTINEIANDCGFSSLAVFSRAIKNYFGVSPEKIRTLSPKERLQELKMVIPPSSLINKNRKKITKQNFLIRIAKMNTVSGVYAIVSFNDTKQIQHAFTTLTKKLRAHDVDVDESKFYGIFSPHQGNIYKAFVAVNDHKTIPGKLNNIEIKGGKYAAFKVRGEKKEIHAAMNYFSQKWLPDSGYKIADVTCFESFADNPTTLPYNKTEREIFIPIETA